MKYIFLYLSENIGGAQVLFARMAEALINSGKEVQIIGNKKNFINDYLKKRDLNFKFFIVSDKNKFNIEKGDLLVISLSFIFLVTKYINFNKNSKIVFWDLHPYALLEATALSKLHKKFTDSFVSHSAAYLEKNFHNKVRRFVEQANSKNALYFMCLRNFNTNKDLFNFDIKPNYLPIPINQNNRLLKGIEIDRGWIHSEIIDICWISRIDSDKLPILELLIEDIVRYNSEDNKCKIQLHVIGNGNAFDSLLIKRKSLGSVLKLQGVLFGHELDNYLRDHINIGFSMGTAALEFAIRKIPTVLVPSTTWCNFFTKETKRYMWLHNSIGFDLAVDKSYLNLEISNFRSIINNYLEKNNQLPEKSYNYVNDNHSFEKVFKRFIQLTGQSSFTYSNLSDTGIYNHSIFQTLIFKIKKFVKIIIDGK